MNASDHAESDWQTETTESYFCQNCEQVECQCVSELIEDASALSEQIEAHDSDFSYINVAGLDPLPQSPYAALSSLMGINPFGDNLGSLNDSTLGALDPSILESLQGAREQQRDVGSYGPFFGASDSKGQHGRVYVPGYASNSQSNVDLATAPVSHYDALQPVPGYQSQRGPCNPHHASSSYTPSSGGDFMCPECGKIFRRRAELSRHWKNQIEPPKYTCSVCGKSFRYPKDLKRHSKRHTKLKDHGCKVCSKHFAREDNLRRHERDVHGIHRESN